MTFKEKIDKILEIKEFKINSVTALEDKVGSGRGAINDFYNRDEQPGRKTLKRILSLRGLNLEWWKTEKGPVFIAGSEENHTSVQNGSDNKENPLGDTDLFQRVVRVGTTEYVVLPKTVLDGEYRISSSLDLEQRAKELDARTKEQEDLRRERIETIDAKNKLIKRLEDEIAYLRARKSVASKGT
jgi:hypothetical protein